MVGTGADSGQRQGRPVAKNSPLWESGHHEEALALWLWLLPTVTTVVFGRGSLFHPISAYPPCASFPLPPLRSVDLAWKPQHCAPSSLIPWPRFMASFQIRLLAISLPVLIPSSAL